VGVEQEETIMKMLTIVCREKFKDDVRILFDSLGIKGYTVMSGAGGSGETGADGRSRSRRSSSPAK
jgi:hypothetical protein